jgi:hypothetical protein
VFVGPFKRPSCVDIPQHTYSTRFVGDSYHDVLGCEGKSFTVTQRICMESTIANLCVTVNHFRILRVLFVWWKSTKDTPSRFSFSRLVGMSDDP